MLRSLVVGLIALSLPGMASAQGRNTKVYYDDAFTFGSKALEQSHTRYFQVLTTPAAEDPDGQMLAYWGPQLDQFFRHVCDNLHLEPAEIYHYLLYPGYFTEIEKLVLEERLHAASFDSLLQLVVDVQEGRVEAPAQPLVLARPREAPAGGLRSGLPVVPRPRRFTERHFERSGDTLFVWLPGAEARTYQRCVLYRTLHDFLATPIGPGLPEGVAGFVPLHDPNLPIVIYASIGEQRLRRTAQHEIGHAIVESIAKYLRRLAPARARAAVRDSGCTRGWRPGSGGFSMVTHENYAEYLAFPHGQMEPALRASLIEMVAENRLDGLAALSIGARSQASSYIEGPARLVFLAETYGHEVPKELLIKYHSNSCGFLDWIESMTGQSLTTVEQLYRRWLREKLWTEYLATAVPDTLGSVLAPALSGVQRNDSLLVHRVRDGRQELVLRTGAAAGDVQETRLARDLDGIERLPLFSSSDLRRGRVVGVVRQRQRESLLLWENSGRKRLRRLRELGEVREVRDPRWSPGGSSVVFRAVDRAGRNALGVYDADADRARLLVPYRWAELSYPSFASDSLVLFSSTATATGRNDVFALELPSGEIHNLTQSPEVSETEPLLVHGRLVYLSDAAGVPRPVEQRADGSTRELFDLPFPVSGMQQSDTLLTVVATSLRHAMAPGARAVWGFPLRRLGLGDSPAPEVPVGPAGPVAAPTPVGSQAADASLAAHHPPAATDVSVAAVTTPAATDGSVAVQPMPPAADASVAAVTTPTATNAPPTTPPGLLADQRGTGEGLAAGISLSPYKQKWGLMPLGLNLSTASTRTRGATYVGMDTEFHDQAVIVAVGQNGDFDRFGIVQYRNSAARTHWHVGGYYRSLIGNYFSTGSTSYTRNQSEAGLMLSGQYHQSLVTRFGAALSLTKRTDARGLVVRADDLTLREANAPVAGLRLQGLDPREWGFAFGGRRGAGPVAGSLPGRRRALGRNGTGRRRAGGDRLPPYRDLRPAERRDLLELQSRHPRLVRRARTEGRFPPRRHPGRGLQRRRHAHLRGRGAAGLAAAGCRARSRPRLVQRALPRPPSSVVPRCRLPGARLY